MLQIVRAETRGQTRIAWLDSRHSFSFGHYHDPARMGFRQLRVINDDRVAPAGGFAPHSHRDMEIISYVVEGALEHKDSLGTGSRIVPGDVQRMSAGTGITHSEFNGSKSAPVRFLQIWIPPAQRGLAPSYEQKHFPAAERADRLRLIASPDGAEGSVTLHADARLYAATLTDGASVSHAILAGRHAWIQIVRGSVSAGSTLLAEGDGLAISDEAGLTLTAQGEAELLVFDLA